MEFFYEVYRSMECDSAGDDFELGFGDPCIRSSQPECDDSMGAAGHSMKQAGSDTADGTKHAYEGTATALPRHQDHGQS
jgi:hypothetical protein